MASALAREAAGSGQQELIGRDDELSAVDAVLRGDGGSSSLLLVGAAGVGKSALLHAGAGTAGRGGRAVLRAAGAQSETRVPFAGLHQLLYPLAERFPLLASPQHEALLTAFGRRGGPPLDWFLIAIATLELLAWSAKGTGLLIVIDDLHWIDDATRLVLGFVARRLATEPVALLAATRPGFEDPLSGTGGPTRMLRPLSRADAERLVLRRHPDLDERRRAWVLAHAEGNPLALTELPLTAAEEEPGPLALVPLTPRLEHSFAARLSGLSVPAQTAAVVAAASDGDDFAEIAAAVALAVPGSDADGLCHAIDAGILVVANATVAFEHPLLRMATYQSARAELRRRAHTALAEVLDGQPERRARHLAAAALVPSEAVATELERAAQAAVLRGAGLAGAAAWERAADLTPRPDLRARRLLRAAELSLELGRLEYASGLAAEAEPLPLTLADRARLTLVEDTLHRGVPGDPLRVRALTAPSAELIDAGEDDLAFRLLLAAAVHVWSADPGPEARASLAAAAGRLPFPEGDSRLLAIGGFSDPARYGDQIARRVAALHPGEVDPVSAELALSVCLVGAGEAVTAVQRAVTERARGEGKRAALPRLLTRQAWNAIVLADWTAAVPAAEEAARLAEELRQPLWQAAALCAQAMIAGMRGDDEAAGRLARDAEAIALPARLGPVLCGIQFARGVAAIGAGRYDEAFDHLYRLFDRADPCYQELHSLWALGDFAEAAARTGRAAEARKILDEFRPAPRDGVAPWTRVALCYADALLADDDHAEAEFDRARRVNLAAWPAYRARLLLEYGSWLRRWRRGHDARPPLRTARQICEAHGLLSWAERARSELRATGETDELPDTESWASLSPQELRIARLAAAGLSNREIGQRLYLSPRTIGSHLYRMFPKLGITSRVQLRNLLDGDPGRQPSSR